MKLLRSLRDRLLKTVLSDVDAGACIPEHGCCCGGPWILQLNCFGACVQASSCFPLSSSRCR